MRNTRKERSPRGKKNISSDGRQEDYRLIAITNPRQSNLVVPQGVSELVWFCSPQCTSNEPELAMVVKPKLQRTFNSFKLAYYTQ